MGCEVAGVSALQRDHALVVRELLAQLAISDINKAESVMKDPALFREMLEHNVLASATVSHSSSLMSSVLSLSISTWMASAISLLVCPGRGTP